MKFKVFAPESARGKPADRFESLEERINEWLGEHPEVKLHHVHRLSQPSFGWGRLALGVWYEE